MASRWVRAVATLPLLLTFACGTDAVGVDACRQIESVRCQRAPSCGISLEPPHRASGTDVDECVRFYDDACLHGLVNGNDPGALAVNSCVAALKSADCTVVVAPESTQACSWLVPAPVSDAGQQDGSAD
jgi:hypothetical protein